MLNTLPHFLLEVDDETNSLGIQEVSYVEYPATGLGYLAFSKENSNDNIKIAESKTQKTFKTLNFNGEFQRMTSGVLMMPDTKYLRVDSNGDYYSVEFSAETLKEALIKYLKEDKQNVVKVEHTGATLDSFKAIEHWIISNSNTRSPIYKLSLEDLGYDPLTIPIGTIMKTTYVSDEAFWNDYILTGKVTGYSLGGMFEMMPVDTQNFLSQRSLLEDLLNKSVKQEKKKKNMKEIIDFLKNQDASIVDNNNNTLNFKDNKVYDETSSILLTGTYEFDNNFIIIIKEGFIVDEGFSETSIIEEPLKVEDVIDIVETEELENTKTEDILKVEKTKEQTIEEVIDLKENLQIPVVEELIEEVLIDLEKESFKAIIENQKEVLESMKAENERLKEEFKISKENSLKKSLISKTNLENKQVLNKITNFVELKIGNNFVKIPK